MTFSASPRAFTIPSIDPTLPTAGSMPRSALSTAGSMLRIDYVSLAARLPSSLDASAAERRSHLFRASDYLGCGSLGFAEVGAMLSDLLGTELTEMLSSLQVIQRSIRASKAAHRHTDAIRVTEREFRLLLLTCTGTSS